MRRSKDQTIATSPISAAGTSTSSGIGGGLTFSAYGHGTTPSAGPGMRTGGGMGDENRGYNMSNGLGLSRPGMQSSTSENHIGSQKQHPFASSSAYANNRAGASSRPGMAQQSMSDYPQNAAPGPSPGNIPRPGSASRSFSANASQHVGIGNNVSSRPQQAHSRQRSRGGSEGPQITSSSSISIGPHRTADDAAKDTPRIHWRALRSEDVEGGRGNDNPFLPVRADFHPKRNQARQKLATLPKNRFKDLASDVFYELNRRFPDFEREVLAERPRQDASESLLPRSNTESPVSAYPPTAAPPSHRPANSSSQPRQAFQASNEVVVPKKSTIAEEVIQVPFARHSHVDSDETESPPSDADRQQQANGQDMIEGETRRRSKRLSNQGRRSATGMREYEERLESPDSENNDPLQQQQSSRNLRPSSRENFRPSSVASDNETRPLESTNGGPSFNASSTSSELLRERKARTDLEAKIAGMERRLASMQKEVDGSIKREEWERNRAKELEDEIRSHKDRAGTLAENVRLLQRDFDAAKASNEQENQRNEGRRREEQAELSMWKDRYRVMEDDLAHHREQIRSLGSRRDQKEHDDAIKELRNELEVLMEELSSLAVRNEELLSDKEEDAAIIRRLQGESQEYKRRWEATKTDLRNLKATQDHMPASADGNIADIHVTQFQNAIDSLLQAARSSQPSSVLSSMKEVVVAISEISEDVRAFEREPNFHVDSSKLENLKHQSSSTLNNLMAAARSHATSSGLLPISLIDAAAGHVSVNVVELIKLLKIRKTVKPSISSASVGRRSFSDMSEARRRSSGVIKPAERTPSLAASEEADLSDHRDSRSEDGLLGPHHAMAHTEQYPPGSHGLIHGNLSKLSPNTSPQRQMRSGSAVSFTSSIGKHSDAFDLERKGSSAGFKPNNVHSATSNDYQQRQQARDDDYADPVETVVPVAQPGPSSEQDHLPPGFVRAPALDNSSAGTEFSETSDSTPAVVETAPSSFAHHAPPREEWESVKPYLSQQSSALVNAIQQLLAEIRSGNNPATSTNNNSRLSEHLSQVIAISSSIVDVSANAMPEHHRDEGQPLLDDMMNSTERLSEHQNSVDFSKNVRQAIASAAFGMAKSLRALMKLNA
ncbi:hypothetical protein QFC21_003940 [Naganishia friedmannii]|uniref:Uncharacterized protein n=1 Tax=Naganishia friedmannii TaxID=89922 RepID=A0ACC2VLH8_9TREE|nr:hypothetical protein QFC21_003940 [Naganishia friedmannii]